ncbi:MAG: DUF1788 domain-containing protein [Candidatus Micrarchaeota archaeon]|nr:DUF1788 domain-containing protein [Candidatus Micrarchaeota archaeon]
MTNILERLEILKDKIMSDKFVEGFGLGNELSYYIFDYDPKDELLVRKVVKYIVKEANSHSKKVIEVDLFKIFIEILKEEDIFDAVLEMEKKEGKEALLNAITTYINPRRFAQKIVSYSTNYDIIFLTGIGKIYPFMRAHNVLNSLQEFLNKKPVVLFYPGKYKDQSLVLFNKFKDDNYYRAFPVVY